MVGGAGPEGQRALAGDRREPRRIGEDGKGWPAKEIVEQIRRTRAQPGVTGHILFSARALLENRAGLATELLKDVWAEPAALP